MCCMWRRPEAGSNGRHMAVKAALVCAHIERERALQQAAKDLHLIGTGVLGNFKPLDQKLWEQETRDKQHREKDETER